MNRTKKREWIVKVLYEMSINELAFFDTNKALDYHEFDDNSKKEILEVLEGIKNHLEEIDELIAKYSNVPVNRITLLDLAILRTSIYEFKITDLIPVKVSINEAVEIAKKYSDASAYKYINGVLSSIEKDR